jgi:transposase InsO family protein
MGHRDVKGLKSSMTGALFDDVYVHNCCVCSMANIRRKKFKKCRMTQAERLLFCIFIDICGPFIIGYRQFLYFMLIVDDFAHYAFIFFLKHRNDALTNFKQYKAAVEKYMDVDVTIIHIDNAPKFVEGDFRAFCLQEGIQFKKLVPDASQQSGVVEHGNQTVENLM